jgi:hypothetical protein
LRFSGIEVSAIHSTATLLAAAVLAGVAPPVGAEPRIAANPSLVVSDEALLQDEAKAGAEFERRLRGQVTARDGLLVIIDRSGTSSGVTVVPASIMWGVDCSDSGLTVTFGTGSGDSDNGIVLQLTSAGISDDACTRIAPAIGQVVLAIVKGD